MAQFIRLLRPAEGKEILLNVAHITKIEVKYGEWSSNPDDRQIYGVTLAQGVADPNAMRTYKVFFGSESYLLPGVPNDPVVSVIQNIYNNAIRSPEPHELPPADEEE